MILMGMKVIANTHMAPETGAFLSDEGQVLHYFELVDGKLLSINTEEIEKVFDVEHPEFWLCQLKGKQ